MGAEPTDRLQHHRKPDFPADQGSWEAGCNYQSAVFYQASTTCINGWRLELPEACRLIEVRNKNTFTAD